MKRILFAFALLAIIPSCSFTVRNNGITGNDNDTVVCHEQFYSIPFYKDEFFVVTKRDTSAYSFLFSKSSEGNTRMSICFMVNRKMFQIFSDESDNDTTAAGGITEEPKTVFYFPKYEGMGSKVKWRK
ncbi:hypothetical protein [Xylanibacter caecicola]|uniref:hypothetical protein n=1 Tax=Xylanibacter caecicola TaxID=2736294 RepID=UPI0025941E4C|nr:hypothetical protein [Xylanibacter caecicola]